MKTHNATLSAVAPFLMLVSLNATPEIGFTYPNYKPAAQANESPQVSALLPKTNVSEASGVFAQEMRSLNSDESAKYAASLQKIFKPTGRSLF